MKNRLKMIESALYEWKERNKVILSDTHRKIIPNTVNVHFHDQVNHNIGDYISPIVVNHMASLNHIDLMKKLRKTKHLYAIGSILYFGYQNCTVWGSGFLNEPSNFANIMHRLLQKMDIRAVRGPLTRKVLLDNGYKCPEIYGDPAILMPLMYPSRSKEKCKDFIVVRHCASSETGDVSPITGDWKFFIDRLNEANLVLSSSLHGIILAESYGIPAILLVDNAVKNLFKYKDYYMGTGREHIPIATSIEEALKMKIPSVPDLSKNRDMLINSFPVDLWL